MKFSKLRTALLLATVAMSMVALSACGGGDDDADATKAPDSKTAAATATKSGGSAPSGEKQEFEIDLTDNKFSQTEISVPVGAEIEFKVVNKGTAVHNMHIMSKAAEGKDFSSDALVNPGEDSKFTATFTKAGTYVFQCDYHVPDMVGKITVK